MRYGFNVDAYSRFYTENKDRLFAYLLRMTGDVQAALDLVQESFTRYLKHYGSAAPKRALLYTIARNAALDTARRQNLSVLKDDNDNPASGNPEQQLIHREAVERMLSALDQLATADRELISLVAAADLTYREIGRVLNISETNVKVRVHRARTKLRSILATGE